MVIANTYGPKHAKAWHTNMPQLIPPKDDNPAAYSEYDKAALKRRTELVTTGMGFLAIQSTKPQTLGYSLSDSPVGLLAWIYEKLVAAVDAYPWTDDEGELIGFAITNWHPVAHFTDSPNMDIHILVLQRRPNGFNTALL